MMVRDQQDPRTNRRWMAIFLMLSLGLNILVVGVIAGAFLRGGPAEHLRPPHGIAALGLRPYYRALDTAARAELAAAAKDKTAQANVPGRAAMRAHLTALAAAIAAEPYDAGNVRKVLAAQADAVAGNISRGHELLLDRIAVMSPDARQSLSKRLTEFPQHRDRRWLRPPN